tara:strand:- start:148 stop:552 length:405 start_codon:yes stop_codon:yes gene_type:complete
MKYEKSNENYKEHIYANKVSDKDRPKPFNETLEIFCTLYYSLEDGEGVKNLTYRERNKFKNVANTYGFKIKSKSQPTDNYELKFYVWKVETYIEKKSRGNYKEYWTESRERIRQQFNLPINEKYYSDFDYFAER